MSDNNNVENDNESDYVYLKRPYLFNIRYNSRTGVEQAAR